MLHMPARPARLAALVALVLAATLVVAGCGGGSGKDVGEARSCLKDAGFDVTGLTGKDKDRMDDATIGSYHDKGLKKVAFASAGVVKSDKDVKQFKDGMDALGSALAAEGTFKSGTSGKYVWAYGGTKGLDKVDDAKDCVEA
jgi:hypothetical protein